MMKKNPHIILALALGIFFALPVDTSAQDAAAAAPSSAPAFSRQGIFGCNQPGAYSMSVGTLGAIGGAYVPVNDAAVTLNTGYLVFKECFLRELVNREREASTAQTVAQTVKQFTTGNNGSPFFPVDLNKDLVARTDEVLNNDIFKNGRLDGLNPAFMDVIKQQLGRNYYSQTRNSGSSLACSYPGSTEQLKSVLTGQSYSGLSDLKALEDPNCIPLYAFNNANNMVMNDMAAGQQEMLTRLGWSNGIYGVEKVDANGNRTTETPGIFVGGDVQQKLQSGFAQQQAANDIGQMVGRFFVNIGINLLNQNGLIGLTQGNAGAPSYLDQVVADSSAGLRDSAINAAIQILLAARQVEMSFIEAENATAAVLIDNIAKLRVAETTCWSMIIPKVKDAAGVTSCTKSANGTETCATSAGPSITMATSTSFSDTVIASQIAPLATTTAYNIQRSTGALNALDQLITDVTNSNSPNAQGIALQQLDLLVSQKVLHTQYDQKAAEQRLQDTQNSVAGIVTDAIRAWGDSKNQNVGWCNVNNADVITMWTNNWKTK